MCKNFRPGAALDGFVRGCMCVCFCGDHHGKLDSRLCTEAQLMSCAPRCDAHAD
ncbi:hypothetical protein BC567DRAFT_220487 [Phyllosticta citribraziliensis]